MGCCSATNCSNRSEKGYKMHKFPANPERRAIWLRNMKRYNWTPTKSTCLCEVHFESSQFENHRADGKRRLKPNAIPTIFENLNLPPLTKIIPLSSTQMIKDEKEEINENLSTQDEENYIAEYIEDTDEEILDVNNLKQKVYDVVETIIKVCQNSNDNSDNEFDIFGKSVAVQLKSLPYDKAIKLQMQLQEQISLFKMRVLQQESAQNT